MEQLILCPLKAEAEALQNALKDLGWRLSLTATKLGGVYECDPYKVALGVGGLSQTKYNEKLSRFLQLYPQLTTLICAGAAGSLKPEVSVGDVVVQSQAMSLDLARISKGFNLIAGSIQWVNRPVQSRAEAETLAQQTKALAVVLEQPDWQAFRLKGFEVRGVTDHADSQAESDFHENLALAMKNVAVVIHSFFTAPKV